MWASFSYTQSSLGPPRRSKSRSASSGGHKLVELAHRQERRTLDVARNVLQRHLFGHGVELILIVDVGHVLVVRAVGGLSAGLKMESFWR